MRNMPPDKRREGADNLTERLIRYSESGQLLEDPLPAHLGRGIRWLSAGQASTAKSLLDLGTSYRNVYHWRGITTKKDRERFSQQILYSSFTWDTLLAELDAGHETEDEAESDLESDTELTSEVVSDKELKSDAHVADNKIVVYDEFGSERRGLSGRVLRASADLHSKKLLSFIPGQSAGTSPEIRLSEPATIIASVSLGPLDPCPIYSSPDRRSDTTVTISLSCGSPEDSTTDLTPPDSANKLDGFAPNPYDGDGGASVFLNQILEKQCTVASSATTTRPHGHVASGHLGDGISWATQSNVFASRVPAHDGQASRDNHANTSPGHTGHVKTGSAARVPAYESIQVAKSVSHTGSGSYLDTNIPAAGYYSVYANSTLSKSHARPTKKPPVDSGGLLPYPKSQHQPWSGINCYDAPFDGGHDTLRPEYMTSKEEKQRLLFHKIVPLRDQDVALRQNRATSAVALAPIHIFVDLSNIMIGFYDSMKTKRGVPVNKRVRPPGFSFVNFNMLLVRDRPVEKRVVAGSLGNNWAGKWPSYMMEAEELGYEMNIMQRVTKTVLPRKRGKSNSNGGFDFSVSSGPETSGDDGYPGLSRSQLKQGEQGVDEILHLKILQSALDYDTRGTILLATGDAARAEYSDGFKKNIERALARGWNIELYSWSRNISSAWKSPEFTERWGHQFRAIELDDYSEELYNWWLKTQE